MSSSEETTTKSKMLPPDVLLRVFSYLPIPTLGKIASVSRRFKVLVNDDEIWDEKLRLMLKNDTGALAATLEGKSRNDGSLIDVQHRIYINNKPLNTLIPGMSTDPFQARARAKSTGLSKERFKELYTQLIPYYTDLRDNNKESNKVLNDYGNEPEVCGQIINLLVGLGECHVMEDWQELNEAVHALSQYFESAVLHEFEIAYDAHDIEGMKTYANASIVLNGGSICIQTYIQKHALFYDNPYKPEDSFIDSTEDITPFKNLMKHITENLKEQSTLIDSIFPKKMDVLYMFLDRVFEDVVAEFVAHLLGKAMQTGSRIYLNTMSVVLESCRLVMDTMVNEEEVTQAIEKERGVNLLFKLFLPFLDDYLYEESQYAEKVTREHIEEWNNRSSAWIDGTARLTNQSREVFKRNYLNAFKKVITLPVDLVSSAATTIASPFHRSSSSVNKRASTQSTLSTTPSVASNLSENKDATVQLESARQELDVLQDYISLETALQVIKINKESERRVEQFIHIGFPGRMKADIQKTFEQIFTQLLKILSTTHIQPGFENATAQLSTYKPNPYSLSEDVPPLTELFELVHVADVIQQMIQLYYDEEITKYVDKLDFINEVNKEKKAFERLLDDCVAQSMDRGIQVLLSQTECILTHEQTKEDYNPPSHAPPELKPTKACEDTILCLKTNTSILAGAAEKGTMDLFFSEICKRFFEILCKHLKMQTVNEQGGFRYISDMNAYYDFVSSLRQRDITTCFLALKSLANIYIIESASDIKLLIHDLERYHGLMRVEDLFEFAACRSDWPTIKRVVQKDMTDCSIM